MGIGRHTHPGAGRLVKHPGRHLQPTVRIGTAQATAKNSASRPLDRRMNADPETKPLMPWVQQFSKLGSVGVLKLCCDTGALTIRRYLVAHDCGTEINPTIVAGQVHGAVAMGLSGAMMEHCAYSTDGQNMAGSFMDYAIARAADLPSIEIIPCNKPNRLTPAGLKGMAEGGVMGAIGALSNAICDALAPFSATAADQPFTPERLMRWIRQGAGHQLDVCSR